jgi:hypothetical protein
MNRTSPIEILSMTDEKSSQVKHNTTHEQMKDHQNGKQKAKLWKKIRKPANAVKDDILHKGLSFNLVTN